MSGNSPYKGCFGSLDGLVLKIKRPVITKDLPNLGVYYCRKGFFALNCQAICDVRKRVLWMSSIHNIGGFPPELTFFKNAAEVRDTSR
jgi:hypothetical protein